MSEEDFELGRLFREELTPERDEMFAARVALEVSRARMTLRIWIAALYLVGLVALVVLAPMIGVLVNAAASAASVAAPGIGVVALGLVVAGGVVLATSRLQPVEA